MLRAINRQSQQEIIILDAQWRGKEHRLRDLSGHDMLLCPQCKQPVIARMGQIKIWHFAHKHKADCTYSDESLSLLQARGLLYNWLCTKFSTGVTVEKQVSGLNLPRPVDCWVETEAGPFAYWIIDRQIKPDERKYIWDSFQRHEIAVNFVFLINFLKEQPAGNTVNNALFYIDLSTTEREFMKHSVYGRSPAHISSDKIYIQGETLHYLDLEIEELTSFRGIQSTSHSYQRYLGEKHQHPLHEVQISPTTGEFVHPGEYERRLEAKEASASTTLSAHSAQGSGSESRHSPSPFKQPPPMDSGIKPKGACIFCGQITNDWWSYDGKTETCKCNSCYKEGRS